MKLNNKILLSNILLSVIIFLITGIGMYYLVKQTIFEELDNHLLQHKYDIDNQLDENHENIAALQKLGDIISNEWIEITPFDGSIEPNKNRFSTIDTIRADIENASSEEYRKLVTTLSIGTEIYNLTIYEEVASWNRISSKILFTILAALLIWILLLYVMNQAVINKILFPFYETVDTLETIKNPTHFNETFPSSNTYEIDVLNKALNTMMMELQRSFEDQKAFMQNASHELLTPLSIIWQKAEKILANSEIIDEEIASSASDIQQTAVRLSRLSNSLLLISRIENKQYALIDKINVQDIVRDILGELDDFIHLKNIHVATEFTSGKIVTGNRELIHSAIFNVLQNAIKFSPNTSDVIVTYGEDKNQRQFLSVRDNGPGIPESLISAVFGRFKKGKQKANTSGLKGTGLGLAIVKSICDLHDFECKAVNSVDNGAVITIYF